MASRTVGSLAVEVHPDPVALGAAAAAAIAGQLRDLLDRQEIVRMVFAAAPSQHETLKALSAAEGIDWRRVDAFHMDEYVGIAADAPQRFGNWLRREFFDAVPLRSAHLIDPSNEPAAEAARYGALAGAAPIDVVLAGIGITGHLAFNDPPADFATTAAVAVVELDELSLRQQVDEGLFARTADVPAQALTMTVPFLLSAGRIFCMVSGNHKRAAVRLTLDEPVSPMAPASPLREHPHARLFLDAAADPGG
ncbi:6-phosphogluconolactonase [Fodinicola acaciae]|uniref:6-phosphogluconolactonase n=1 Tax=Fodinicola acaciae TaxID=2681555 RepID=UPI0013D2D802|nr:6-phosphogluconolactonase [Fodinicola acaciae]